jgi:hypothetical protein
MPAWLAARDPARSRRRAANGDPAVTLHTEQGTTAGESVTIRRGSDCRIDLKERQP